MKQSIRPLVRTTWSIERTRATMKVLELSRIRLGVGIANLERALRFNGRLGNSDDLVRPRL